MLNLATRSVFKNSLLRSSLALPPSRAVNYSFNRTLVTLKDHKYTAHATADGQGRAGTVKSDGLQLKLAPPKALGGTGKGENPEQLFAMGYSSCFLGALQLVAGKMGKGESAKKALVHTSVHIGEPKEMSGFGLAVDIKVEGVDEDVIQAAHEICPYSRALKHGIVVNVSKA